MQLNLMVVNFINQNTVLLAELEQYLMNLWQYSKLTSSFYMVDEPPEISKNTKVIIQLNGHQMTTYKPLEVEIKESIVELKFEFQKKELFDLVNLVQPGFVRKKERRWELTLEFIPTGI